VTGLAGVRLVTHPVNTSAAGHQEIRQQYADARVSQIYPGTRKVMKFTVE